MLPEYQLPDHQLVSLQPVPESSSGTTLLPGSREFAAEADYGSIRIYSWTNSLFQLCFKIFSFIRRISLQVRNKRHGFRFEAVLEGAVQITHTGGDTEELKEGHYRITDVKEFQALFSSSSATRFFITCFSKESLEKIGLADQIKTCPPRMLAPEMLQLIKAVSSNPYNEEIRDFFYENCIRELLFIHLSVKQHRLPGELSDNDLAAILQADALIMEDLSKHYTIRELSRKVGLNEFKLKRGFRNVFNQGVFRRLAEHRLKYACMLLESTEMSVEDIADSVGYSNASTFIPAFSKRYGHSPLVWRKLRRKGEI